jgi:LacI family transcriptional regulator
VGATIGDVAREAGVSPTTVSRVLAGSQRVHPATRERVVAVMAALEYRPSQVARSLRERRTRTIGLIVTDIGNPFFPAIVHGVEDAARAQGRAVLLCNGSEDPEREVEYLDLLLERRVDGVIVASGGLTRRHGAVLGRYAIPVVLVNASLPGSEVPAVLSDNRAGGRLAAEHLLALGHDHLVHIAGPPGSEPMSARLRGLREAVAASSRPVTVEVVPGDGHLTGGAAGVRAAVARRPPPFGIFAHNDLTAIGALHALAELGIKTPEEVAVVGFDDIPLAAYASPELTTIAQDSYGMGAWAAGAIDRLAGGETVTGVHTLPVRLVQRRSTSARPPA